MKKDLTTEILSNWWSMTDNNNHIEVRIEIAEFFGVKYQGRLSFADAFKEEKMIRDAANRVNLTAENILTAAMLDTIRETYGRAIADLVNACL